VNGGIAGDQDGFTTRIGVLISGDAHKKKIGRLGKHTRGASTPTEIDLSPIEGLKQGGSREVIPPNHAHSQRGEATLQTLLATQGFQMHQALRHTDAQLAEPAGLLLLGGDGPLSNRRIESGDLLVVRAAPAQVLALREEEGLELPDEQIPLKGSGAPGDPLGLCLVEALIPPESSLIGQTVMEMRFAQRFNAVVLAIRRSRELLRSRLGQVELRMGDSLLLQTPRPSLRGLQVSRDFLLVDSADIPEDRRDRLPWALGLTLAALALSVWRSDAVVVWLLLAVMGLLLTRVLTTQEVYAAIRWDVVVLLAALLPLTTLLHHSGADQWLVAQVQKFSGTTTPYGLLVGLYLITALLTEVMANQAAVALMLPISLGVSHSLGLNTGAAVAVVIFAASHSFLTPIGYQTNAMVFAVGNYRLIDFLRLGLPLTACLCLLTPALALQLFP